MLQVHVGEAYYLGSKGMDRDSAEAFRWLSRFALGYCSFCWLLRFALGCYSRHPAGLGAASCRKVDQVYKQEAQRAVHNTRGQMHGITALSQC